MHESFDFSNVALTAKQLIETGDQGEAQLLLRRALLGCGPAGSEGEAIGMAEATRLLVSLDIGLSPSEVSEEHVQRLWRLTSGFDSAEVATARAAAELQLFEWVHAVDDVDPVVFVDVLHRASAFADTSLRASYEGVRRAGAEAALTAQMIRTWLGQDDSSIALALESLAVALQGETDERMRHIRLEALFRAAKLRIDLGDAKDDLSFMLRIVAKEASELPTARGMFYEATIRLADLDLADGATSDQALQNAFIALGMSFPDGADSPRLRCWLLRQILERIPPDDRDRAAAAEWGKVIDHYAAHKDQHVRNELLDQVRLQGGSIEELTDTDLQILKHADQAFRTDHDPGTAVARFLLGARIVEALGAPDSTAAHVLVTHRRDTGLAVKLSEDLESRFRNLEIDPLLGNHMARLFLDRALRVSDLGRHGQALAMVSAFRERFGTTHGVIGRHLFAQADYWAGRFQRESGNHAQSKKTVDAMVDEFGADPDPDVRTWAANALFSAWRDTTIPAAEVDVLLNRFHELFGSDSDIRIRRRDASRRLFQAVRTHEQGAAEQAVASLNQLVTHYGEETDPDIKETVGLARENLNVISLSGPHTSPPRDDNERQYRDLRDRLYLADEKFDAGYADEAEQEWKAVADVTAGSADPRIALLGLAALDAWGGYLNDTGRWEQVLIVARRGMVMGEGMDYRAARTRARAYLRFGIAQGRIGDPRAAIATYEALDALTAQSSDDEIATTRQQALYNRAILIDDIGDPRAAIEAYDHVVAVHQSSTDSRTRRLRQVKALRNKALLLDNLGHITEVAMTHKLILDIVLRAPDQELNERARLSAFDLAGCYARLGDHSSAAGTYEWISTDQRLGFSTNDIKSAKRAHKGAQRQARRLLR